MIKLSKKQLRAEAEYQEGYYFTGNVYSYENVIFYIGQLAWKTETGKKTENKKRIARLIVFRSRAIQFRFLLVLLCYDFFDVGKAFQP